MTVWGTSQWTIIQLYLQFPVSNSILYLPQVNPMSTSNKSVIWQASALYWPANTRQMPAIWLYSLHNHLNQTATLIEFFCEFVREFSVKVVPYWCMGVIVDIAHKTADRLLSSSVTVPEHNGVWKCSHRWFCISRLNERVTFEHAHCATTGSKVTKLRVNFTLCACP